MGSITMSINGNPKKSTSIFNPCVAYASEPEASSPLVNGEIQTGDTALRPDP